MRKYLFIIVFMIILLPKTAFALAESARSACLIDALTGNIVFEKDAYTRRPMASTTKIMTAIVALENSGMDETVKISANAQNQEGSSAYVRVGSDMRMGDLLYGLMLNSGNDAAVAIAEHIAGSTDRFASMMTDKARSIGAMDTAFANPNGLDDPEHFTTAHDLALIARYAMKNPDFAKIVSTKSILTHPINSDKELWFINHNKLLRRYDGCIGVKTGYTKTSGRCLVSAAERDGMTFIAVTLNDGSDWSDHAQMLDYAFQAHTPREIISEGERVKTVSTDSGDCFFVTASSFTMPFCEGHMKETELRTHLANNLAAPVNAGEKVGYTEIIYNGETVGTVDIISDSNIYGTDSLTAKNSFFNSIMRVFRLWCV